MRQRPENINPPDEDPEETLVTPRFDADDARRAHPVVPLVEAPVRSTHTRRTRAPRRRWLPALLAVALLTVAALGGALVTKVMQSPRAGQAQEQTPAAPVQAAEEAPPPQPAAAEEVPRAETPAARPAPRESHTRRERVVVAEPVREVADEDVDDRDDRGKASEKRRGHEDDFEKELRKAAKRAKGKAPRLVDVLTSSP